MRRSSLLASLILHGAAVVTVSGWGMYAALEQERPQARLVVARQDARAPAPVQAMDLPEARPEQVLDVLPVLDVQVVDPEPEAEPESDPRLPGRPLVSPSEVLQRVTLERVVVRPAKPEPAPEPVEPPPDEAANPSAASAPSARVEAQRIDTRELEYPVRERRLRHEGTVVLRIAVAADGTVECVDVLEPSPYPGLDRAAVRSARKWRFEPAMVDGVPVASQVDIEVVYQLTASR